MGFLYLWGISMLVLVAFIMGISLYAMLGLLVAKGISSLLGYSYLDPKREIVNNVIAIIFMFLAISAAIAVNIM